MEPLNWIFLESSVLAAVAFRRGILRVCFRDGKLYRYLDIPEDLFQKLLAAQSKGAFFNAHVRDRFPYRQIKSTKPSPTRNFAGKPEN